MSIHVFIKKSCDKCLAPPLRSLKSLQIFENMKGIACYWEFVVKAVCTQKQWFRDLCEWVIYSVLSLPIQWRCISISYSVYVYAVTYREYSSDRNSQWKTGYNDLWYSLSRSLIHQEGAMVQLYFSDWEIGKIGL